MEPVPLQNCLQQLNSLNYSPIIGNKPMNKDTSQPNSQIPVFNQNRPKSISSASVASSLGPINSPTSKKRLFSETSPPPPSNLENKSKQIKMNPEELDAALNSFFEKIKKENNEQNELNRKEISKLSQKLTDTEKTITDNFSLFSGQITDLQNKQNSETMARQALQTEVTTLQEKVSELSNQVGSSALPDTQSVVEAILPLVTEALSDLINGQTAEVKAYNAQAKATLVNEIKSYEKDLMLYGFKEENDVELYVDIKTRIFENIFDLCIDDFRAMKIGIARGDRPVPIRLTFQSVEDKNNVLGNAFKLPRGISIEKCMPRRYRNKNREFRRYGWELKQADETLITRTVFKGHRLVLEMKQKDEEGKKYDWTIAKEYYPEPQSPTEHASGDQAEAKRSREGLFPSKTLEMINKNFIFFSDLTVKENKETTVKYLQEVYLNQEDKTKIVEISVDQIMEKHFVKMKLSKREYCQELKKKYEKQPFNGGLPKVTVLLGND